MNDEWQEWVKDAEARGIDVNEVIEAARRFHRRMLFVSTMDRLAAVTVGFIIGLVCGCLLT